MPSEGFAALKAPSSVAGMLPPQNPLALLNGRFLFGAYACQQLENQRVTAEEYRARFDPNWQDGEGEMAYAIYCFDMTYYEGDGSFVLEWWGDTPTAGNLFLGLGNMERDSWEWYLGGSEPLNVADLAPYQDEHEYLLLVVAVIGDNQSVLSSVQIGERVIQEGVDMSMLCAPVVDWETQVTKDEFAARNPVEQDYTYVAEEVIEGMTWAVISHVVDGLTHYGILRIPPYVEGEQNPVLLLCHPGFGGGTGVNGDGWFKSLVDDTVVYDEFLVVMPSFRGEPVAGGSMGSYVSEGTGSIYDRDSDDAIAMLDCVLNHFPQADTDAIVTTGWSRGAQVAMRAAERDQRIDGVIDFAGWTDEWVISGQAYAYYALPELEEEPEPGDALYEYDHKLWELKNGLCDVWDMRQLMLRMSVSYCAADMPRIQIHHGEQDTGVPIEQAGNMVGWLEWESGKQFEYYPYANGTHSVFSMDGAGERARDFLASFISK